MKKIISILLCLAMLFTLFSIGAVSAGAADKAAPKWEQRQDGKVYFYADTKLMDGTITLYIYDHTCGEELIPWGSKRGKMTDEGNNIWSFDFAEKGITLSEGKQYGIIITSDWGVQTCDIIFSTECLGDMLYAREATVENNIDSNKRSYVPEWVNADREIYAPPVCITSIGNVVGTAYWDDEDSYSLFKRFLSSFGSCSLSNAVKHNGKTARETAEYVADELGLTSDEFDRALDETFVDLDNYVPWDRDSYFVRLQDTCHVFFGVQKMYAYIQDENGESLYPFGSDKWLMETSYENEWEFYFTGDEFDFDPDKSYTIMFTPDWKNSTNKLSFGYDNFYGTAITSGASYGDDESGMIYDIFWEEFSLSDYFYMKVDSDIIGEPVQKISALIRANGEEEGIFPIDSAESEMHYFDDDRWRYILEDFGYSLIFGKNYTVTFIINGKFFTNPLHLSTNCNGYTARLTGAKLAGDGGRDIYEVIWDDENAVGSYQAPDWEQRDDGKIYFYADQDVDSDIMTIYAYIFNDSIGYEQESKESGVPYGWGSKKYAMTNEGHGIWSYDPADYGITIESGKDYRVYFTPDWSSYYADIELSVDNLGDIAYVYRSYYDYLALYYYGYYSYNDIDWVNDNIYHYISGDLNESGDLDILDVTILQCYLAEFTENGIPIIDEDDILMQAAGDINCDGVLSIDDVTLMQRVLARYVLESPYSKQLKVIA